MRNTPVYLITMYVLDHEGMGSEAIKEQLSYNRYFHPNVIDVKEANAGKWHDDHPLNKYSQCNAEINRLFGTNFDSTPPTPAEGER